jgi:hypothetical protein
MRQNIRMQTADDLMIARVIRDQELRSMKLEPMVQAKWKPADNADVELVAYCFVFGFLIIGICFVLALA